MGFFAVFLINIYGHFTILKKYLCCLAKDQNVILKKYYKKVSLKKIQNL